MLVLDSSSIIEILKGTDTGIMIATELENNQISTTVFNLYEVFLGVKNNEIEKIESFFSNIEVINFDNISAREASKIEKELINKGKLINKIDIFIASMCKLNNATLITTDADFKKIDGLNTKLFTV